ncbi:MAG: cytochrome c1 [Gammaproteobacteria bacterium]|jgi:ubiquinol-cytochrome c reductase cytochrome c1 subunit
MKRTVIALVLLAVPCLALAAEGGANLEQAKNNLNNTASLQRGAKYFVNYCMGCHSLKYVRYNSILDDLALSDSELAKNLMFTADSSREMMKNAIPEADAKRWFGKIPPDLSLESRSRSPDWIYTYLKSFYLDPSRATGVNNTVLNNASMPDILWPLQGMQKAVFRTERDAEGNKQQVFDHFESVSKGRMDPEQFDAVVRDIVNFLDYVGEPVKTKRQNMGFGVLGFLLVFFLFAYALKREFWKDVH